MFVREFGDVINSEAFLLRSCVVVVGFFLLQRACESGRRRFLCSTQHDPNVGSTTAAPSTRLPGTPPVSLPAFPFTRDVHRMAGSRSRPRGAAGSQFPSDPLFFFFPLCQEGMMFVFLILCFLILCFLFLFLFLFSLPSFPPVECFPRTMHCTSTSLTNCSRKLWSSTAESGRILCSIVSLSSDHSSQGRSDSVCSNNPGLRIRIDSGLPGKWASGCVRRSGIDSSGRSSSTRSSFRICRGLSCRPAAAATTGAIAITTATATHLPEANSQRIPSWTPGNASSSEPSQTESSLCKSELSSKVRPEEERWGICSSGLFLSC